MRNFVILMILICFLVSSCTSYAETYVEENPNLSPEVRKAILESRVIKGMTPDEVIASWGDPSKKIWEPIETGSKRIFKRFMYYQADSGVRVGFGIAAFNSGYGSGVGVHSQRSGSYAIVYFEAGKVIRLEMATEE